MCIFTTLYISTYNKNGSIFQTLSIPTSISTGANDQEGIKQEIIDVVGSPGTPANTT